MVVAGYYWNLDSARTRIAMHKTAYSCVVLDAVNINHDFLFLFLLKILIAEDDRRRGWVMVNEISSKKLFMQEQWRMFLPRVCYLSINTLRCANYRREKRERRHICFKIFVH